VFFFFALQQQMSSASIKPNKKKMFDSVNSKMGDSETVRIVGTVEKLLDRVNRKTI
jgi:hypothetical protein